MSQQQKKPDAAIPSTDGKKLTGNSAAKHAAAHAHDVLAQPVAESLEAFLQKARLLPDINGQDGGGTIMDWGQWNGRDKNSEIRDRINKGLIDPETMQWIDRAQVLSRKICICLDPPCRIGPFIPFRK